MSWHFSQALVAAYSADTSSAGAPSAPSSVSPTHALYCAPDRMKVFSRLSRFGTTCGPLTDDLGAGVLTWCLAGSPAKTYPQPAKAQESTESAAECGRTWRESFTRWDRASSLWRTPQCSLLAGLDVFSETWPRWGMMRAGECSVQLMPVLRTSETESGLWATPTASTGGKEPEGKTGRKLVTQVAMWPTPVSRMWKDSGSPSEYNRNEVPLAAQVGGQLNPTWVEKLMGWPKNWTRIDPMIDADLFSWIMGFCEHEKTRTHQALHLLRRSAYAQSFQRKTGRPFGIQEAEVLLSRLREHSNGFDEAWVQLAGTEAPEADVRGVRTRTEPSGSPLGSGHPQQLPGEHPDSLQTLSRLLAYDGKAAWEDQSWENAVPRVATGVAARVDRLKAIGNGQVPSVAALAWRILSK